MRKKKEKEYICLQKNHTCRISQTSQLVYPTRNTPKQLYPAINETMHTALTNPSQKPIYSGHTICMSLWIDIKDLN